MDRDRTARLSEGQRECLRMVFRHMETKEIARELGISPDGVTQRIKTAMRILGVSRRKDAARILAEAEDLSPYPPLVHLSRDIDAASDSAIMTPSTGGEQWQHGGPSSEGMREEQAVFETGSAPQLGGFRLPLPVKGGRPDDLTHFQRLVWVFAIMVAIAFAFGVFLAGVEALSRIGLEV
jgi:DNA-binding CsgD family transcriptional regulator